MKNHENHRKPIPIQKSPYIATENSRNEGRQPNPTNILKAGNGHGDGVTPPPKTRKKPEMGTGGGVTPPPCLFSEIYTKLQHQGKTTNHDWKLMRNR